MTDVMSTDDLFGEDVKPDVGAHRVKAEKPVQDEEMEDLFGDDDAEEKTRADTPVAGSVEDDGSDGLSASELRHRKELEYEEDEGQEEAVVELKHAVLELPNLPTPHSSDGVKWLLKMPNFVKLDPKPFDPETYVGPEIDGTHEKEKSLSIRLEVENTIRWRWKKDDPGNSTKQSNSRIIKWSDGSLSLLLGKELFDINQTYEGAPERAPSQSQSQSQTQSQVPSQQNGPAVGAVYSYLVAQHKRAGILQAEAPIKGHMTLRPTGMQSETHRKLARAVGQKHSRVARLRIAPDSILSEEQQDNSTSHKKIRRSRTGGEGGSERRKRRSYGRRRENVWSDDEPEMHNFGETDDDDDMAYGGAQRKSRRPSGEGADRMDSKRGAGDYQTDDFLVADSDEEEADDGEKRRDKRKSRTSKEDKEEPDALDELDAKIARQEEESRRRKKAAEREGEAENKGEIHRDTDNMEDSGDVDMEVESEDEDVFVRRTGAGSRKKRAIAVEEEDDE